MGDRKSDQVDAAAVVLRTFFCSVILGNNWLQLPFTLLAFYQSSMQLG
jgi:hypothetical protein